MIGAISGLRSKALLVLASIFLFASLQAATMPGAALAASACTASTGSSTNCDWANLVLRDGGWPATSNNLTVVMQWMTSEEPSSDWWHHNNPLNNGEGSGGGSGLGSYADLFTAAHFVAVNLHSGIANYPAVTADLAASADPTTTSKAIWSSGWSCGHYSGVKTCSNPPQSTWGQAWNRATTFSIVAAPATSWGSTAPPPAASSVPVAIARPGGVYEDVFDNRSGLIGANWSQLSNSATGQWNLSIPLVGGASAVGKPAIALRPNSSSNPVYDVFTRDSNNKVEESWYNYISGTWGGWILVGSTTVSGDPQVLLRSDGSHYDVFTESNGVLGTDWFKFSDGTSGSWSRSGTLHGGTQATGDVSVQPRPGVSSTYDAFVRDSNGQIEETWYRDDTGGWGGWIIVGPTAMTSSPRALPRSGGIYYDVIAETGGVLGANWYQFSNGATGLWIKSGALIGGAQADGDPSVVLRPGSTIYDVFVRSSSGLIEESWYRYDTGKWGGWIAVGSGSRTGDPTALARPGGSKEDVFAANGALIGANWFTYATGATGQWTNLG
jgi:hypothetical protein